MSSEECSIRLLTPEVDEIWSPKGGEPVIIGFGTMSPIVSG